MTATISRSGASPTDAVVPWAIAQIDGLVSTRQRIVLDDDLLRVFVSYPQYAATFFAGVISDLVQTLPKGDTMRLLSARIVSAYPEQNDLVRGWRPEAPTNTGALTPSGVEFGTQKLGSATNPDSDIEFAALSCPLGLEAAALIAFAADGWHVARQAMDMLRETAVAEAANQPVPAEDDDGRALAADAGERMFDIATDALRWAMHRRRFVYDRQPAPHVRGVDEFPRDSCWSWTARADQICRGKFSTAMASSMAADIRHAALI